MVDEPGRTHQKTIKTIFLVEALEAVEDTAHHIVAAGRLTSGKDDTDIKRLLNALGSLVGNKLHYRHSVCVREKFSDFCLIGDGFSGLAVIDFNRTLKGFRKFGLI